MLANTEIETRPRQDGDNTNNRHGWDQDEVVIRQRQDGDKTDTRLRQQDNTKNRRGMRPRWDQDETKISPWFCYIPTLSFKSWS